MKPDTRLGNKKKVGSKLTRRDPYGRDKTKIDKTFLQGEKRGRRGEESLGGGDRFPTKGETILIKTGAPRSLNSEWVRNKNLINGKAPDRWLLS